MALPQTKVAIILVEPQMGENIGAAARAMNNFALTDLRLVNPRDGWPNDSAITMAAGAFDLMPSPALFPDLQSAIADLHHVYATTARRRDMAKPFLTPREAAQDCAHYKSTTPQRAGFVFGRERNGLDNEEIALCQTLVHIPVNPDFGSLNLGQAVLLQAYETFMAQNQHEKNFLPASSIQPAPQAELDEFFIRLHDGLDDAAYFRSPGLKPTLWRNIRTIFMRAELSTQDINTLHGVITALMGLRKTGYKRKTHAGK